MAGLLTAHILRRFQPVIYEAQSSLPNNHAALLRFRSDAVSRATGIPFKQVEVSKAIFYRDHIYTQPNLELSNLYSRKVTGEYLSRSIGDLSTVTRYIAPADFIAQMSKGLDIKYNQLLTIAVMDQPQPSPVISTIPMPAMMQMTGWKGPEFKFKTIWSATATILSPNTYLHQTIYFPHPVQNYYRASITGNQFILEFSSKPYSDATMASDLETALAAFGIACTKLSPISFKEQKYGKLLPIDNEDRRRFILALTDQFRIYSVGRFATWRQILMDDVVQDVAQVERWITDRDGYQRRLEGC